MKKILNNKGMTLVEIILSIGLVSIVMVQVLNILVDLKDEQLLGKDKTKDLTNRSIIMRTVQEDFMTRPIKSVGKCSTNPSISGYSIRSCIIIKYEPDTPSGSVLDYYMITANSTDTTDTNDYFIYGRFGSTTLYEAWPLASGTYPLAEDANHCGYVFERDSCTASEDKCANGRYFRIMYPVALSAANENSSMNFDLEFLYYFRSTSTLDSLYENNILLCNVA